MTIPTTEKPNINSDIEFPDTPIQDKEVLKSLNILRREAHDLQRLLMLANQDENILKENLHYIEKTMADLKKVMEQVPDADPHGSSMYHDAYRHLNNLWEQLCESPLLDAAKINDANTKFTGAQFAFLDDTLHRLIYQVSVLIVPSELMDWLSSSRSGYYIPFHEFYADRVPAYADRVALLKHLKWSPKLLNGGLVDEQNGFILRYSTVPSERRVSFLVVLGVLMLASLLVALVPQLAEADSSVKGEGPLLFLGWLAALAGLAVHVAVGMAKRQSPPIIALGELHLLINARAGNIILNILLALFAYLGFVATSGIENLTVLSAFLVGYSLDSFVGLVTDRISGLSNAQQAKYSGITTG